MNTTQAQQKALNDALLALVDRLEFGKCNMGLKTDIKPKEATFQVVLDALALTPFYRAFLITADVPAIYMKEFWATDSVHTDLGYTGDITYLTDVNVDYLHQPWRAFATVINKCLSGKETGMDKIRLSRETRCFGTLLEMTPFTSMRCISRHEDTQAYGTILPKELTNQAMLESNAYKTYYAFASGEKAPKPKYVPKKADPDTSPKQKPIQATKGDGVDTQSKVPDEQQQKSSSTDEGTDEDNENDSNDRSDECGDDNDHDDDTNDDDEETDKFYEEEEEEENSDDEETMYDDENDEVTKELYEDVNVNLGNEDTEMTNADQGTTDQQNVSQQSRFKQVEEDAHLLNLENPSPPDNEIASLMDTTAQHATTIPEITSSFTITVPPPPHFFNPLSQQEIPTPTPTASETTTSLPALPDFASVFKFNERVFNLEKDVSKIKQVDQYAQALSSIPAIVDLYMDNKLGEAINKAILAHNLDCKQEAQDEKNDSIK
ncbi:hypothetical protein Tco_0206983, partial [Tanacetum coccineum]